MSLSYIPYVHIDLLERLDLQTLNNAFEKLYVNDLFYSEIGKIAPKVFVDGAIYQPGDCVWYNTEDPDEFILSSNVHWRMIQARTKEYNFPQYSILSNDLFVVNGQDTWRPNISSETNGGLSQEDWNILSATYKEMISAAYDIGNISDDVQIYQYVGQQATMLTIPRTVENVVGNKTSSKNNIRHFYEGTWEPRINTSVTKQQIREYVINLINTKHLTDTGSSEYREHIDYDESNYLQFDEEYLDDDLSNIDDDVCQLNIPNLRYDDVGNINNGFDYVFETVITPTRGYRLWKSGLLEHWGSIDVTDEDMTNLSGLSIPLLWKYEDSDGAVYLSKTYTYDQNLDGTLTTTNTNVNSTANVFKDSQYLLDDNNRYQVMYTWCNDGDNGNLYYKGIIQKDQQTIDSNVMNFTECNVFNVKNTSFTIPNVPYILTDGTTIHHLHTHLYYYTTGFTKLISSSTCNNLCAYVAQETDEFKQYISDTPIRCTQYFSDFLSLSSGQLLSYWHAADKMLSAYWLSSNYTTISSFNDLSCGFRNTICAELSILSGTSEISSWNSIYKNTISSGIQLDGVICSDMWSQLSDLATKERDLSIYISSYNSDTKTYQPVLNVVHISTDFINDITLLNSSDHISDMINCDNLYVYYNSMVFKEQYELCGQYQKVN